MAIELTEETVKEMFPSTKTQTLNKLITENSLTRLVNRLLDMDSYVITTEFTESSKVVMNGSYDYLLVAGDILSANLEFCIRGYYFNLGEYLSLLPKIREKYPDLQPGEVIKAIIYVDSNSNPDFPELYGQTRIEPATVTIINGDYSIGEDLEDPNASISNVKFYDGQGQQVSVDMTNVFIKDNKFVRLIDETTTTPVDLSGVSVIKFVQKVNVSSVYLFRSNDTEDVDKPTNPGGQSAQLTEYTLVLFKMNEDNEFTIPLSSIHKFSSLAVESIDGGLIQK